MDVPRIEALERYWQQYPPTDLLMARQLGYKPPAPKAKKLDDNAVQELFRIFPGGRIVGQ